jgi:hypothetical protein
LQNAFGIKEKPQMAENGAAGRYARIIKYRTRVTPQP